MIQTIIHFLRAGFESDAFSRSITLVGIVALASLLVLLCGSIFMDAVQGREGSQKIRPLDFFMVPFILILFVVGAIRIGLILHIL